MSLTLFRFSILPPIIVILALVPLYLNVHVLFPGKKFALLSRSVGRAKSVARYLVSKGVPEDSIQITSHSENNPLIKTGDNVREPRNRRVEVIVR